MKKYSFWWDNSAPDFAFQPQLPLHTDAVIIGAGFAGISTAYWLARLTKKNRKPYRIIILDEAPYAGFKSTGRMTGSVYLGSNKSPAVVVDELGEVTAKKLYTYGSRNNHLLHSIISKMSCNAEFNGGFRMASTVKEAVRLEESVEILKDWDFHPVFFDHNQSQHIMVAPLIKGSMFIPEEGMIDPFEFVNQMARLLRRHNVWIVYGARVKEAKFNNEHGAQLHLENGHVMTVGKVVHTTSNTVPWNRIEEFIIRKREHVIRTTPFSEDLDDMPLPLMPIELNNGLDSARIFERSIVMAGGKSGLRKQDPELDVVNDSSCNQRILDYLDTTMMRNFPFSNHTEISHTWTYIETGTKDGLPLIGVIPGMPGHYVSIGYSRNKFGLAFMAGKNIAERLLKIKVTDKEFSIFAPKRLTRGEN